MKVIKNATLLYVKLSEPIPDVDGTGKHYEFSFVVDEDTSDKWERAYRKQKPKSVPTAEFKDKYKIDPPFPGAKKQYILKLKKKVKGDDNDEKYRVRAYVGDEDITTTKLIANGSVADVVFDDFSNDFGTFARPVSVKITNFIEYQRKEKSEEVF